jgi:hypothetical protein
MGLECPPIAFVVVSPALAQLQRDHTVADKIRRSPGLNFGSRLIGPAVPFATVATGHLQAAAEVFAFDLLIENSDRRKDKPNLLQTNDGYIVIDHELAFPFSRPAMFPAGLPPLWEFTRVDAIVASHLLFPALLGHGLEVDFAPFGARLRALTDEVLGLIAEAVPPGWHTEELQHIRERIAAARDHAGLVEQMLRKAIA